LGYSSKFQPVSHLDFVAAPTSLNRGQPKFARCLAVSWAGTVVHYTSRPFRISSTAISPVSSVRDLGVHIDSDLTMRSHVVATVRSCFAALRQIRSVRRSLTPQALLTLVRALVVSNIGYCISVLAGVSAHLLDILQSVLNAAARLIFSARKSERISPLLRELHWLRVPERI